MNDNKIDTSEKMYACEYIIIFDDKAICKYLIDEDISLDDVMNIAKKNGFKRGTLTVILETMRSGTIYQYGNYGDYWVKHGGTNGLA